MARMARVVIPGYPHHVTQRGSRSQPVFFDAADFSGYRVLLGSLRQRAGVSIWAYCLMPNHVHLIAVPEAADSLARFFGSAHLRYTRRINLRENWRGHLWQERFHSFVMDERHLLAAVRYVELNPVRAGLCRRPEDWPWSSANAHLGRGVDPLVDPGPMLERVGNWAEYLGQSPVVTDLESLRRHGRTGRPAGSDAFISALEQVSGRCLRPRKSGPKPRDGIE
jgi:putative transposase